MLRGALAGSFRLSKNQKNVLTGYSVGSPTSSKAPTGRLTWPANDRTPGVVSQISVLSKSQQEDTPQKDQSMYLFVRDRNVVVESRPEDCDAFGLGYELSEHRRGCQQQQCILPHCCRTSKLQGEDMQEVRRYRQDVLTQASPSLIYLRLSSASRKKLPT
jgi:hypothetical protein